MASDDRRDRPSNERPDRIEGFDELAGLGEDEFLQAFLGYG